MKPSKAKPHTPLPWKWDGEERGYVGECSHLGGTGIALDSTYEGSSKDCAYVAVAVNERPALLAERAALISEVARLRALATALAGGVTSLMAIYERSPEVATDAEWRPIEGALAAREALRAAATPPSGGAS